MTALRSTTSSSCSAPTKSRHPHVPSSAPSGELGPGASLRCGLAALGEDVEAAVIVLGDGPTLDPRAIDRVVAAWRESAAERVAATYEGVRLHPLLLARSVWSTVPDEGLRELPAQLVPCDDLEPPGDVDFADELTR